MPPEGELRPRPPDIEMAIEGPQGLGQPLLHPGGDGVGGPCEGVGWGGSTLAGTIFGGGGGCRTGGMGDFRVVRMHTLSVMEVMAVRAGV